MSEPSKKPTALLPLVLIAALLAAILVVPRVLREPAALPAAFQPAPLDAAIERGREASKPVLVLVTSDTCAACDRLKRTTLSDDAVAAALADRFIPVNVNESVAPGDARRLPYRYLPTTLVIHDGAVVARLEGFRPTDDYLEWLNWAADAVQAPAPPGAP